jgi:segregation and condensation protein A
MSSAFTVKAGNFEGPLELLLDLIEKRKLLINDVSLSAVADDYIAHIEQQGSFPMRDAADFIFVASTLLLIKSKSLLPVLQLSTEEKGDIADLERRLALLQKFRNLSVHIKNAFGKTPIFAPQTRTQAPVFSPHEKITIPHLLNVIHEALRNLPKKEFLPEVAVRTVISIEEMIERLSGRVQSALSMSFRDFAGVGKKEKVEVIVGFLAMLELVKRGLIAVKQDQHFADITMETGEVGVPNYS